MKKLLPAQDRFWFDVTDESEIRKLCAAFTQVKQVVPSLTAWQRVLNIPVYEDGEWLAMIDNIRETPFFRPREQAVLPAPVNLPVTAFIAEDSYTLQTIADNIFYVSVSA